MPAGGGGGGGGGNSGGRCRGQRALGLLQLPWKLPGYLLMPPAAARSAQRRHQKLQVATAAPELLLLRL